MTHQSDSAPRLFLLGDSIIDNAPYVGSAQTVTDCVNALWPAGATCIAIDGAGLQHMADQFEATLAAGFRPEHDVLVLSVMGNNLRQLFGVFNQEVNNVLEGMTAMYRGIHPVLAAYDATVAALKNRGVKHLVLVSIYPIYDITLYAGDLLDGEVIDRSLSWVAINPVLGIVSRHVIDTAKKHGAVAADLFGGDFGPEDIVRAIEPGANASPKVAARIVAAAHEVLARS